LKGSEFEWLFHLLQALGKGKIQEFNNVIIQNGDFISKFPNILKEQTFLEQKVRIIAFLEMVFECGKDERSIKFK